MTEEHRFQASSSWIIVRDGEPVIETWDKKLANKLRERCKTNVRVVPIIEWLRPQHSAAEQ